MVIVIGSMISLGYYLPVIAAMWMREAPSEQPGAGELPAGRRRAGARRRGAARRSPAARPSSTSPRRGRPGRRSCFVARLAGAATLFFGIVPQPLFNLVHHAGSALGGLFF